MRRTILALAGLICLFSALGGCAGGEGELPPAAAYADVEYHNPFNGINGEFEDGTLRTR